MWDALAMDVDALEEISRCANVINERDKTACLEPELAYDDQAPARISYRQQVEQPHRRFSQVYRFPYVNLATLTIT